MSQPGRVHVKTITYYHMVVIIISNCFGRLATVQELQLPMSKCKQDREIHALL